MSDEVSFYIHQDRLLWSRAQTLGVVQIAALGGSYPLLTSDTEQRLGVALLIAGGVLTFILIMVMFRDRAVRKLNKLPCGFKTNAKRAFYSAWLRGEEWLLIVSFACIVADIGFWAYLHYRAPAP